VNGFSNHILLATSVSPSSGLAASLSPSSITGSGTSKLIVSTSASGSYSVNITGTSDAVVHWTLVNITVSSGSPSGTPSLGVPPFAIYAVVAAVAAVALLSLLLILRRRKNRA
jgi:hypothetical protein